MKKWIERLQKFGDRWWYAPVVGVLAFIDCFVVVIPTDGLMITATVMAPRRWIYNALITTIGSSIGAMVLAHLVDVHGHGLVLQLFPTIHETSAWIWTQKLMDRWGAVAVFLIALSPFMQHPAVIIAGLIAMPPVTLFSAVFLGRVIKYLLLSWIASHAPNLLGTIWGIQDELKEVLPEEKSAAPKRLPDL